MVDKLTTLSESDLMILQEMAAEHLRKKQNGRAFNTKLWKEGDDQNTSDVYIAIPPEAGIPALTQAGDAPGEDDEPGFADCDLYQIVHNDPTDPLLKKMDFGPVRVYNLTGSDILPGAGWVVPVKTKQGYWVVQPAGGEIGGFAVVNPTGEVCDGIGFTCDCAIATVVTAACGSGVSPGDQINVWDLCRLWFNLPPEVLMANSFYCQYVKIHEDDYNRPPGLTGTCRWIVVGMCCREVTYYGY